MLKKVYKKLGSLPLNQQYYTAVKNVELKHKRNIRGWELKDKAGKTLSNIEDILENWTAFYEELYHSDRANFTPVAEENGFINPSVTTREFESALQKLKNNKAPGPDGITAEMLKHGGKKLQTALHKISDMIITHHAKLPTQLDLSEIIVLSKKGDILDCNNYRPICLLCHVYKLATMILYRRISS